MKFTQEDIEIIDKIKTNAPPFIKGALLSLPFIVLAMAAFVSGTKLSALVFITAQFFCMTCFHRENRLTVPKKIIVITILFVVGVLLLK